MDVLQNAICITTVSVIQNPKMYHNSIFEKFYIYCEQCNTLHYTTLIKENIENREYSECVTNPYFVSHGDVL